MRKLVEDSNYDVIAISESWLNSTVINAEVELIGYKLWRLDRQKKQNAGGDVCVYIPTVHWKQRCWRIWLAFRVQASISCGCRFSITNWDPFSCVLPIDHLTVSQIVLWMILWIRTHKRWLVERKSLSVGDLNCDMLKILPETDALNNLCSSLNLTQLITSPTRVTMQSSSLIDVMASNQC